jgi:hypothetical protein
MYDIASDAKTGDWLFTANTDIQGVAGEQVIEQRVINRLRIYQGWTLDPSNGQLGSRIKDALRLTTDRGLIELPLMVREALNPMRDIQIIDVSAQISPDNSRAVTVRIEYQAIDTDIADFVEADAAEAITVELDIL